MAKRFGRQQKRKLKKQLQESERRCDRFSRDYYDLHSAFEEWESRIKSYFGADSSLNPRISKHETNGFSRGPQDYPLRDPLPMPSKVEEMFTKDGYQFLTEQFRRERMFRFTMMLEDLPDQYRRLIRFVEIDGQANESRYMISKEQFHRFGLDEDAIWFMARDIAKKLIRLTNENRI
jgi:hypothetical protein